MKIGSIGNLIKGLSVENIKFYSKNNLLDYDVIFVDLEVLHYEIWNEFRFIQVSDEIQMNASIQLLHARTANMKSFFAHGGVAIVTMNFDPSKLYQEYSHIGQVLEKNIFHLLDILGVNHAGIEVEELLGDQFYDLGILKDLDNIFQFNYKYRFTQTLGQKILKTKKGNDVVALRVISESGFCYLLPHFKKSLSIEDRVGRARLLDTLKGLLPSVQVTTDFTYPEWIDDYVIYDEVQVLALHRLLLNERQALDAKIEISKSRLNDYRQLKRLVFAGDQSLELAVQHAFETFGFQITVPEGNKDDLNIIEDDFKAVIEIKGLTKSGSTMNAMQLEKWVTNYAIENESDLPKGILIVNPFKAIVPNLRTETVFPKDMLDFSIARKHCLMKTEDLLTMLVDFQAGLISKVEITELLKASVGEFKYIPRFQ